MTPAAIDYPLPVDNTVLQAMAKCSTYTFVRYVLGFTTVEEKALLKAGSVTHSALDRWFRGADIKTVMNIMATEYGEWAEANVNLELRVWVGEIIRGCGW